MQTMGRRKTNYVQIIDEALCKGCVHCMKACPTKAIRVREGRIARIEGTCIDCGECIRACPRGAVEAITSTSDLSNLSAYAIISVNPVLYLQFGENVLPNDVLLALRKVFKYVYDEGQTYEIFNVVMDLHIKDNRKKVDPIWPLISPYCPVVTRLIAHRFPSLLEHVPSIITPREIAGKDIKERLESENVVKVEDIGVYHVTPCSAEMISIREPMALEVSYLDGTIGINEVYAIVEKNLKSIAGDAILHRSGGVGIGWSGSGGEIAGMGSGRFLAVSGIKETTRYLEKIEMGLLTDVEYIEFRACTEGCIGGPLSVRDRYHAKYIAQRMTRMFGIEKRIAPGFVYDAYKSGWFHAEMNRKPPDDGGKHVHVATAITRMAEVEAILDRLPGKDCGACGSPDCAVFAEDVVDGGNAIENCIFQKG